MSPPRSPPVRAAPLLLGVALAAATFAAFAAHRGPPAGTPSPTKSWEETAWRRPLDNWGEGRAWRSTTPEGDEITLFVRTKTGFCNCFGGIADDAEIDRIGDVDLHGDDFVPVAPGRPVSVGDLSGRERPFRATGKWSGARHVLSIVAAADCKAVVATIVSRAPVSPATAAAALSLLTRNEFRSWAANQ